MCNDLSRFQNGTKSSANPWSQREYLPPLPSLPIPRARRLGLSIRTNVLSLLQRERGYADRFLCGSLGQGSGFYERG